MIKVFYGPESAFNQSLPERIRPRTLTQLINESDMNARGLFLNQDGARQKPKRTRVTNLVARTHEYARLSNSGLNGFLSILSEYDIENMYFQNPPIVIVNQLQDEFGDELKIEEYTFNKLDMHNVEEFYDGYDNKILGQQKVSLKLTNSLYRIAQGYNREKPLVLLFYGPSGVGKTETAKFIANILDENLFRKQFSMYQSGEFGNYVFGGNHTESSLARDLLDRESNVILFDEFDKPNQIFYSAFYQMFDEGVFEDKNYKVNLKNSIIICTSNFSDTKDIVNSLGEPIYSRIDDVIQFNPLDPDTIKELIQISLAKNYGELNEDDKQLVDYEQTLKVLFELGNGVSNARLVDKMVKEYIFTTIILKRFRT
ncbi:AAA family ATPase [Vagococcus lutrae]|uniref:AAA family ATPase n=1 Tax=Vagococcus lutrae TaxID=81947 RepID=UPI001927D178|nr:AAA family ATPase [Vagococcus lutrae]UQF11455.1 AAA family ATPase [Vagococcus lutrae]UQF71636.1 AAA family ATPase [Vagococcus lutrae]GEQ61662.1 ATPase [Vagococcus lutrae]GEQ63209.1 ATPase [Vagococcus lutrae]GEQ65101.1 ATPase [Vagococcus lutrae]